MGPRKLLDEVRKPGKSVKRAFIFPLSTEEKEKGVSVSGSKVSIQHFQIYPPPPPSEREGDVLLFISDLFPLSFRCA